LADKNKRKLVFKLPMTSSGYGQFILSDVKELTQEFLAKMKNFQRLRVHNEYYLIEKYIEKRRESCIAVSNGENERRSILGISYTKYDPERYPCEEKYPLKELQGTVRLLQSEVNTKGETELWDSFLDISSKLQLELQAPFLYVEFIIEENSSSEKNHGAKRKRNEIPFYINEISYRPDDAGFISRIAHEKSQFDLFVESLKSAIDSGFKINSARPLPINPSDEYCCYTLIPHKKILFTKEALNQEKGSGSSQVLFRLYEKTLSDADGEIPEIPVPKRRIIGYLMHHASQDGKEILETRLKNLGLSPDTIEILVKALERTKKQLAQGRR
jgi:hypothetical protein